MFLDGSDRILLIKKKMKEKKIVTYKITYYKILKEEEITHKIWVIFLTSLVLAT